MLEKIQELLQEVDAFTSSDAAEIEQFRIRFSGKKGILNDIFSKFKEVPNDQKKEFGQRINQLKQAVEQKLATLKEGLVTETAEQKEDLTRPGFPTELGSRHPISLIRNRVIEIFRSIGFAVADGPEIEDDWHNFTALNLPEYHPARDMQDTFFIETNPDILLRTHTSSVQIRYMEQNEPPIRILSPGRVFRNEAISSRSHCIFHQIEGLYIDQNVSFADLKQTIQYFTTELFGKSKIRLRPSYFPFTEPSAEVDVYWGLNSETDYRITKGTGWLEIMGCGMVDPAVLTNVNIDPEKYSGYAFGMGIERIVMLLYQMSDIRMFFENDKRMLQQFKSL
ncbi:phenylalanine--tRNA ligase subunit alpha [Chryseobacterium salipaludis]|uniref:phenylalanine--tRNA ligase subunit alpha n=1 Tax=Chryseobacterium TaxID=59732 RepID=UPI001FF4FFDB|nr:MULTISPECIES: phenylalanine--tRNA ligase subunit alpha [Chryseobacterium]MCJ8497840.1 phenylalanine--tRNA ligase subunit alpha [Chryseobacterium salipaludis]MCX3296961.1 phenylalanine--tRNA ligase subunit alpha [Planobacterium sp. JC490]